MPANLTPDYERAEQRYRSAATDDERLEALREMFATLPKHKGTEKLQADLKRKISQSRKTIAKKPPRGTDLFHIPRAGAGQVVLVGEPNSGKSMLVSRMTHAPVKVADYPFTTSLPVPGMAHYQDVQIEFVDTPPVTADHIPGGLLGTLRNSDIIAVVIDASQNPLEQTEMVLTLLGSRGLSLRSVPLNQLDPSDFNQHSAILIANKLDQTIPEEIGTLRELYSQRLELIAVSALTGQGLDVLLQRIWELLCLVRVYTKQPGKTAEKVKPFTLELGSTVEDLAREIHQELPEKMTFARIWGNGRFSGQQVHRTEVLHDGDVVEIHE